MDVIGSTHSQNVMLNSQPQVAEPEFAKVESAPQAPVEEVASEAAPQPPADSFSHKSAANTLVGTANHAAVSGAFNQNNSGVSLGTVKVASAKVENSEGFQPQVLEQTAKQLSAWLDVSQAMKPAAYNNGISGLDNKAGFFCQAVNVATVQRNNIDKKLADMAKMDPVDEVQKEQLTQLRDLADGMIDMYSHLSTASSAKEANRMADTNNLITDLIKLNDALANLDPAIVGEETCASIRNSLDQISELAMAFPTIETNPNGTTPSRQLGFFFLQTFRRLQQIENGQRKRASETPDMAGALKTYENDARDCCKRMAMFGNIRKQVIEQGITDPAVVKEMLQEAIKGAPALQGSIEQFAVSYANLAAADIKHQSARKNLANAQADLKQAQNELNIAQDNLIAAQNSITGATLLLKTNMASKELGAAIQQRTNQDVHTLFEYSNDLHDEAGKHIENFSKLHVRGVEYANVAQAEALAAGAYLNTAEKAVGVIENGSHAKYFQTETNKIHGHIDNTRNDLKATYNGAENVKEQFSQLDSFALSLQANNDMVANNLANLDASIALVDLMDQTDQMVAKDIDRAYQRVANDIVGFAAKNDIDLSSDMRAYLRDPVGFLAAHEDETGNIREEFSELLEENPKLAEMVAKDMQGIKHDFQVSRQVVEAKLLKSGLSKEQVQMKLDSMESSLVNGLLNKSPCIFEAMMAANDPKNSGINEMINWMKSTQISMTGHMVADEGMRKSALNSFESQLQSESLKFARDNIADRTKEYGQPVSTEVASFYLSDIGTTRNMNVYIFQKDGKFYALDPLTNNMYKGATKDEAMKDFATSYNQANGRVSYQDSKGVVNSFDIREPERTVGRDIAMTGVGFVGGLLLLVPEPTMATKVAGYGMVAASASYFITKGTTAIIEQASHDNFDMSRKESRDAVMDIVSGLLSVAGTAGSMALRGTGTAIQTGRTGSQVLRVGSALSRSSKLGKVAVALEKGNNIWTVGSSTLSFEESMVQILSDNNLSTEEKANAISEQLSMLVPNLVSAL